MLTHWLIPGPDIEVYKLCTDIDSDSEVSENCSETTRVLTHWLIPKTLDTAPSAGLSQLQQLDVDDETEKMLTKAAEAKGVALEI